MNPNDFPSAILSPYSSIAPNSSVPIYEGPVLIGPPAESIAASGTVVFRWLPTPKIVFEFLTSDFNKYHSGEEVECRISSDFDPDVLHISSENMSFNPEGSQRKLSGEVAGHFYQGCEGPVSRIIFHVPNFLKTFGKQAVWFKDGQPVFSTGRMTLDSDKWNITIDDISDRSKAFAELKSSRGYAITHLGEVRRIDGSEFQFRDIEALLEDLGLFLSWSRGNWTAPFLHIGFQSDGKEQWKRWQAPLVDHWRVVNHWFPDHDTSNIQVAWESFRDRLNDPVWREVLLRALNWYLVCNRFEGGAEGSIIMAQAALEMLSWNRFVAEKGSTARAFKDLAASERLRLPLNEASLPMGIPSILSALVNAAEPKRFDWEDGPHATTEIRNMLVHPTPVKLSKLQRLSNDEIYQGYMLSMWYLEVTLLFYLRYEGIYYNRCKFDIHYGDTEKVPWS
ncbi:MAG: hypothetical protein PSX80_14855 [bacterium]|nr:hypothetical protein [bacterium]